jgi:hypothetical protein
MGCWLGWWGVDLLLYSLHETRQYKQRVHSKTHVYALFTCATQDVFRQRQR